MMSENTEPKQKKVNKNLIGNVILAVVVLLSLLLAVFSVRQLMQNNAKTTNDNEFKQITTRLESPSSLFGAAKSVSSQDSILKKAEYKSSATIDNLLKETATTLN